MVIKCRECKTVYDDNEKYCPYCFTRTKQIVRYQTNTNHRFEGSVMKKRASIPFNYQKRAMTRFKNKNNKVQIFFFSILFAFFLVFAFIVWMYNSLIFY